MADRVGFEPTVELPLRSISSRVPSTTQPPVLKIAERMQTASARALVINPKRYSRKPVYDQKRIP